MGSIDKLPRIKSSVPATETIVPVEVMDRCIEIYLSTGNMASAGRAIGRSKSWTSQFFKRDDVKERMRNATLAFKENPKIANIEECLERLSEITRGSQLQHLVDRVRDMTIKKGKDHTDVADAIEKLSRSTPQIEGNQIKAITMLLTAQGALDPKRAARDDSNEVLEDVILALEKARMVDHVLDRLSSRQIIDITPTEPRPEG